MFVSILFASSVGVLVGSIKLLSEVGKRTACPKLRGSALVWDPSRALARARLARGM